MEKINKEKEVYSYQDSYFIDIFKLITYSSIGVFIFFIPCRLDGQTKTMLYHMTYKLQLNWESFLKVSTIIYVSLGLIKELYTNNKKKVVIKKIYICLRLLSIFVMISIFYGKNEFILLNENTSFLIEETILNLITVLPIGAIFMPFIMEYGLLDIVESYFHKFMKNTFKLSGKTVVNILIYIFTDCFCGYFMTNKLYKEGKIRESEMCMIILNFSIVSYSMLNYICEEFSLNKNSFIPIVLGVLFLNNMILCRIYPISKKSKSYYVKTTYKETVHKSNKFKKGLKKYISNKSNKSIFIHIINNLEAVLNLLIILIPNIVIVMYVGDIIISNEIIIGFVKQVFYPVSSLFKVDNYNQLNIFIVNILYNDIIGVELVYKNISEATKLLMGIIVVLKCTSISTNVIFSLSSEIAIRKRDFILCYIEKIVIIILIYYSIYYFYMGYII